MGRLRSNQNYPKKELSLLFTNHHLTVSTPGVSVPPPLATSLYAGTPLSLTCSVTVDSAVDIPVVVDIVWERPRDSGESIVNMSVATESAIGNTYTDILDITILSSRDRIVNCRAVVRRPGDDPFVTSSSEGVRGLNITVECELLVVVDVTMWCACI